MNITTTRHEATPLHTAEATAAPGNPLLDGLFRVTARTSSHLAATPSKRGGAPSAADVIRAVWNGDARADEYELRIVRSEDADDRDVS